MIMDRKGPRVFVRASKDHRNLSPPPHLPIVNHQNPELFPPGAQMTLVFE